MMKRLLVLAAVSSLVAWGAPLAAELTPTSPDAPFPRASTDIAQVPPTSSSERDSLFGLETAADPKRPDAPEQGAARVRFSGFYNFELAYTYSDPGHWSRAVNRLQLLADGDLGQGVKWKLGFRADIDPVHYGSDFYVDAVNRDQRADLFWRENYLDFNAGGWDFRLGAQQIVWGEVVGLFFADVVSARDMREFLLPSFDIIRIPQWAARAEYFFEGDTHLELVWIPVPTFDLIGKPGAEFYPVPLPVPVSESAAAMFYDPEKPSRKLSNSNYGVRVNTLAQGWDLSAFYYRSFNTHPTFYFLTDQSTETGFAYRPRYERIWQAGGTFSKDFGSFVLRGEAVYSSSQDYALENPLAMPGGVASRAAVDAIVGLDLSPSTDTRVNVQLFNRSILDGGEGDLMVKTAGFGASILASIKVGEFEPQILWIHNFKDAGGLVRPRIAWTAAKNVTIIGGVDIFTGPSNGYFGRYDDRDRVYTEVRYDF